MSDETDKREIQALTILSKKRREFQKILDSKEFNKSYESCKDLVTKTLACIKTISIYVETIHQELEAVGKLSKQYNILLGEYLKNNLHKLLNAVSATEGVSTTEGTHGQKKHRGRFKWDIQTTAADRSTASNGTNRQQPSEGIRVTKRPDVDLNEVKRQRELQLLAQQQQELMQLIMHTETVITKLETEAECSSEDFELIKGSLEKWTDSLETEKEEFERREAERKQKQEEEMVEKEREEREKKRKKEEEKKRKLEEEKNKKERKEQEKRKKEGEERKRKEEEEKKRKEDEEERKKKEIEKLEKKRQKEEERKRKEDEIRREQEEERMNREREEQEKRKKEGEERKRKEEEERKRKEDEEERKKKEIEELEKKRQKEEERKRKEDEIRREQEEERMNREREEQEKRRQEEEERKRKEQEKRRKEEAEERRRKEKIRRDPQNWKPFIYSRDDDKSSYHKGTTCIVKAMEDILLKSDLCCLASDSNKDLEGCFERDERLVSSLINIKHLKSTGDKFEVPVQVYIPCNMPDDSLEVILKVSTGKDTWKISDKLLTSSFKETPVMPLKGRFLQSARQFHNGLDGIGTTSSLFEINCDDETGQDIMMELYGQGSDEDKEIYVGSEKLHKRPRKPKAEKEKDDDGREEEAEENCASDSIDDLYWTVLKRCESTLVTQLSINDVLNYLKRTDTLSLSDSKIKAIMSKRTRGDQVREFIKQLSFLGPHALEAFVDSLSKTNQKSLAELIDSKLKEAESKDNTTLVKSKLHVVYKLNGGKWNLMDNMDIVEDSGGINFRLPSQNKTYELIAMTSSQSMTTDQVCKAAESLCSHTNETKATLICRQKGDNPQDTYIHCLRSEQAKNRIMELKDMGYTKGPAESAEFCIKDGEDIHVTFDLNIRFNCLLGNATTLKFYSYRDSARLSGNLEVIDKKTKYKMYHGNLNYTVGCRPKISPYIGSMAIYLPNPEWPSDRPCYAPLMLDVPVQAVAKFLAFKFTVDSQFQDQWEDFIGNLESQSSRLRTIQTRVNREYKDQSERVKNEKFILNWAKERPVAEDKILSIVQALGIVGLRGIQTETKEFAHNYRNGGILSDNLLKEIVSHMEDHWEVLSINLGVSKEDRQRIKTEYEQNQARALVMLDEWRLTDTAIEKGKDIVSFLLRASKDADCSQSVLLKIQQYV